MNGLLLVQMHGEPGSGKSTLARALGSRVPAVVLDKDIVSSGLMRSGLAKGAVGAAAYETVWGLTRSLLEQGFSVVVDSPCYWRRIEETGRGIARAAHATYGMVECLCADRGELARRLAERPALASQPREVIDWLAQPGTERPNGARLCIDATRPLAEIADEAAAYLLRLVAA